MTTIAVKNWEGGSAGEIEVSAALFDVTRNDALVHQVYVALSANERIAIAHTKDRSERAGSGKKPWKQKGTGRARIGSVRAPHWHKGGVAFGPTKDRNFSKGTTKKMRQKAVLIALSEKLRAGKLIVLDTLALSEKKTKHFVTGLEQLSITGRSVFVGTTLEEKSWESVMRNIQKVDTELVENVNVKDLLDKEYFVMSRNGVKIIETRFAEWAERLSAK